MTYSERELQFTFAKNLNCQVVLIDVQKFQLFCCVHQIVLRSIYTNTGHNVTVYVHFFDCCFMQQNYFEWSFKTYLKIVLLSLSGTCTNRSSSHFCWTLGRNISSHVIVIYIVNRQKLLHADSVVNLLSDAAIGWEVLLSSTTLAAVCDTFISKMTCVEGDFKSYCNYNHLEMT